MMQVRDLADDPEMQIHHYHAIKRAIARELPPEAFVPDRRRALWIVPLGLSIVLASGLLLRWPLPWYCCVLLAILLGNQYASLMFYGHEIVHGTMTRSRLLTQLLSYPSLLMFCVPPCFLKVWHVVVHHRSTNIAGCDPDTFGSIDELKGNRFGTLLRRLAPGSGHPLSILYLLVGFTGQAQFALWRYAEALIHDSRTKRRARIESLLMGSFWIVLGVLCGARGFLYVVLIPMMTANLIVMAYIVTNHFVRPIGVNRSPLENTMSVSTLRILDRLHFNFSHHVEHHMFPWMSARYAPLVREGLQRHAKEVYLCPPHVRALVAVFRTPRFYDGEMALVEPTSGRRVSLESIESWLRGERGGGFPRS